MEYGGGCLFSRGSLSPSRLGLYPDRGSFLSSGSNFPLSKFPSRPADKDKVPRGGHWDLGTGLVSPHIPLATAPHPPRGKEVFLCFSFFSQKEHLNLKESVLPQYMFGVIMPESKRRYNVELQK